MRSPFSQDSGKNSTSLLELPEEEGGSLIVDFTVFSTTAATLFLLLLVELVRRRIDRHAEEKQFARAVLETMYREFTTLGTVEAFIFLLMHYHEEISEPFEKVFTSVHFTFFFIAVFNVLQTVALVLLAKKQSLEEWVKTEELENDYFHSIRGESQTLETRLEKLGCRNIHSSVFSYVRGRILHPFLTKKYNKLKGQILYHKMREDFIETYNLDRDFPVCNYLKKCEMGDLKSLLEIKETYWFATMGLVIGLYFCSGIIHAGTKSHRIVGFFLGAFTVGCSFLFISICWFVYVKMNTIYIKVLQSKKYDVETNAAEPQTAQLGLFWGKRPHRIITILQLLQFGFSIIFSVLLVWSQSIHASEPQIEWRWLVLTPVICYIILLRIAMFIIPRYTLCTSLGQLVRQNCLQQVVCKLQLKEEKLKRTQFVMSKHENISQNEDKDLSSQKISLENEVAESTETKKEEKLPSNRNRRVSIIKFAEDTIEEQKKCGHSFITLLESSKYQHFSSVLTTLFVTFIVAMRVEVVEINNGTLFDINNSFQIDTSALFWMEMSILSLNIIINGIVVVMSAVSWCHNPSHGNIVSGLFDTGLAIICLSLLITAEVKRCDDTAHAQCLPFGERHDGGIGIIEPFTIFIFLRIFKYTFVSWLVQIKQKYRSRNENREEEKDNLNDDERCPFDRQTGTATELWKSATQSYPDIVQQYGEFSSELLQAMVFGPTNIIPHTQFSDINEG